MERVKVVFLIIALIMLPHVVRSQHLVRVTKRDFRVKEEGFRVAWQHLKMGDVLFRKGTGSYPAALKHYRMAYHYNAEDPGLNYRIGLCYLYTDHKEKALSSLQAAYAGDTALAPDIHYYLGRAFQYRYEFDKALQSYRAFLQAAEVDPKDPLVRRARKHLAECEAGRELVKDTVPATIVDMGSAINSPWDDYKPVLTAEGDKLYFTSRRQYSPKQLPNRYDGKYEEDIYLSTGGGNGEAHHTNSVPERSRDAARHLCCPAAPVAGCG